MVRKRNYGSNAVFLEGGKRSELKLMCLVRMKLVKT